MEYRKDIDGLRAISVLAVILYHFFPSYIKGGFIGVDVFFVISGYLITKIIYSKFDSGFCLVDFYVKRIKRILPALLFVVGSCLIAGYFVLLANEYQSLGKHAFANSLFIMNFALWKESGYFDTASDLKPFLHLWSLAIEEQFYFIWPIAFYLAWKKRFNTISLTIFIIIVSMTLNVKFVKNHNVAVFYLPFFRAWELACGALLAQLLSSPPNKYIIYAIKKIDELLNKIIYVDHQLKQYILLKNIAATIGFLGLIIFSITFSKIHKFPGWYALVPVLSAMLIIAAGADSWINSKILSNKIFVWVGLISYPLYLWHWPLLSFALILEGNVLSNLLRIVIIGISFIMAIISYYFVEKPIRFSSSKRIVPLILLIISITMGGYGYFTYKNNGFVNRQVNIYSTDIDQNLNDEELFKNSSNCKSLDIFNKNKAEFCYSKTSRPELIIIGDSHSIALGFGAIIEKNLNSAFLSFSGALPFYNYFVYGPSHIIEERQSIFHNMFYTTIEAAKMNSVKYVLFVSRGPMYISGQGFGIELEEYALTNWQFKHINLQNLKPLSQQTVFVKEYINIIKRVLSLGKKVIFSIDIPELGIDPNSCLSRPITITKESPAQCINKRSIIDERNKSYLEAVRQIKAAIPELIIHDPTSSFCDKEYCYGKINNDLVYFDDDHLNTRGAKILIEDLMAKVPLEWDKYTK